ncbi:hypothetical protein [Paraburkholderia lacunae]|uniref:hypothetical protein n=1 Tax=Paraburkholderia lacunae TaxID=2211104 RepID=UPI00105846F7|nr:hypothetical protein [Paraburkholderia lacunae]
MRNADGTHPSPLHARYLVRFRRPFDAGCHAASWGAGFTAAPSDRRPVARRGVRRLRQRQGRFRNRKIAENGHEHYLIPVLPECSAERIVPLIARGANNVADELDLLDPEPIITRALDQTRMLSFARDSAAYFSTLQSHADGMISPVFFKDANGIYTGCNAVFERFLGKSVCDVAPPGPRTHLSQGRSRPRVRRRHPDLYGGGARPCRPGAHGALP